MMQKSTWFIPMKHSSKSTLGDDAKRERKDGKGYIAFLAIGCFVMFAAALGHKQTAYAAPLSETDFHSKVQAIYAFAPPTKAEADAKSKQMDEFWDLVKSDKEYYLPLLRKELSNPNNPCIFFFDGSQLLLTFSSDRADKDLVLLVIPRVDLQWIQIDMYVRIVHWLSVNGLDTREAAFRILDYPDAKAIFPQHALTLNQDWMLVLMLFPMQEQTFLPDLVKRLSEEKQVQSQKSILTALWCTVTPIGTKTLRACSMDPDKPEEVRDHAKALLELKPSKLSSLNYILWDEDLLREERRKVIRRRISDEALEEFKEDTMKLIAKQR